MFWQHEYLQYARTLSASLDAASCPTSTHSAASPSRDAAIVSDRLVIQLGWHVILNGTFGRWDYVGNPLNGGAGIAV